MVAIDFDTLGVLMSKIRCEQRIGFHLSSAALLTLSQFFKKSVSLGITRKKACSSISYAYVQQV